MGAQARCLSTCLVGVSSKLLTQTKQRYASTQAHLHAIAKAREYEHADSRSAYACIHLRRTCTTARTHSLMDPMHIYGACDRVSIERASICAYVHKYLGPSDCRLPPLPFLFVLSPATCTRGSKIQCIAPNRVCRLIFYRKITRGSKIRDQSVPTKLLHICRDSNGNAINRILWMGAQARCLSTCLVGVSSKLLTQTKQRYASTQAHLHAIAKAREYEHADSRSAYACIHLRRTCTTARTHSLMDPMHIYGACDRVSIERASICAYVHKYLGPSDCRLW